MRNSNQLLIRLTIVYKNKKIDTFEERIKPYHVILASIRLDEKNASWVVIHNGLIWHNMQAIKLKTLDAYNYPLIDCYLVFHKKWLKGKNLK